MLLAVAPLLFWAWLNNETSVQAKNNSEDTKLLSDKKKNDAKLNKAKKKMSTDKALEIMFDYGFLPQLPAMHIPAIIISVQDSSDTGFQSINFQEAKKPVLLHFWSTLCPPCKRELPVFAEFVSSQDEIDVYTITSEINNSDTYAANKIWDFYHSHNIKSLNVCVDINGRLASFLSVTGIPVTFLISSDGLLLGRFLGATHWDNPDLAAALVAFMQ